MVKVFLVCSGLGRINRGYESFAQECFEALVDAPELDITLFKGGGPVEKKQVVLWNLPRSTRFCAWLGKMIGKDGYWVEQITFTLSLLWHIARQKPDVVYFSDCNVGNLLWHWRRLSRRKFKLLLSNGGPLAPPFPRWDYVQQVAPAHLEAALAAGQAADRQRLLPYGIRMDAELHVPPLQERSDLRAALGLPADRSIVLSVGAVNAEQKRMDYTVREVASLPEPRPYLVMLGQQDERTTEIRALAESLLGLEGFLINTVSHADVASYYRCADAFVLASLHEGFGRVFLEAMSQGLICIAHDYDVTRYVLGEVGFLNDLSKSNNLAHLISLALLEGDSVNKRCLIHQNVFERFSWQHLSSFYVDMINHCAAI